MRRAFGNEAPGRPPTCMRGMEFGLERFDARSGISLVETWRMTTKWALTPALSHLRRAREEEKARDLSHEASIVFGTELTSGFSKCRSKTRAASLRDPIHVGRMPREACKA